MKFVLVNVKDGRLVDFWCRTRKGDAAGTHGAANRQMRRANTWSTQCSTRGEDDLATSSREDARQAQFTTEVPTPIILRVCRMVERMLKFLSRDLSDRSAVWLVRDQTDGD